MRRFVFRFCHCLCVFFHLISSVILLFINMMIFYHIIFFPEGKGTFWV